MPNEKVISTQALIEKFQWALDQKVGYIYGALWEKWTEEKQEQLNKTTSKEKANSRKYGSKWYGHYVTDCSGLFAWAFSQLGGKMYHGSDTMYRKWCADHGKLSNGKREDGKTLKPGTAVFVWNGTKYSHVGLYIGNGEVIEAAGARSGVCKSKVTDTKWAYWGELLGVDYSGNYVPEPTPVEPTYPTLRRGSKGESVKTLQAKLIELGYSLPKYGIDGDFGKETEEAVRKFQKDNGLTVDGVVGKKTWEALLSDKPKLEPLYTITIRHLTSTQVQKLASEYNETTITGE